MARPVRKRFLPYHLYHAYPDRDLVDVIPPSPSVQWREFIPQTVDCGDMIFRGIALELGTENPTPTEMHDRIVRIVSDAQNVMLAIEQLGSDI